MVYKGVRIPVLAEPAASDSALRRRTVESALKSLNANERQVILIGFFEGSTCEEIAVRLGLTPGAVKRAARSGLMQLHRILVKENA